LVPKQHVAPGGFLDTPHGHGDSPGSPLEDAEVKETLTPLAVFAIWTMVVATVIGLTRFAMFFGKKWTYNDIKPGSEHGPRWYASLNRVFINSVEGFALFAPAVIAHALVSVQGAAAINPLVLTLSWVVVGARVLYTVYYAATGYNIGCSFIWLAGFVPNLGIWLLLFA
jgi:uncharacterized MAPEG superfamily protein